MNINKGNSQVDLRNEKCPMNLVKFKFYLHEFFQNKALKTLEVSLNLEDEGAKNIADFLDYKKIDFKVLKTHQNIKILISQNQP
jgi:TusA-related sulfurtransferase